MAFVINVKKNHRAIIEYWDGSTKVCAEGAHFYFLFYSSPKKVLWTRNEEDHMNGDTILKEYALTQIPMNEQMHDLPEFDVVTKDGMTVQINTSCFFQIVDVEKAVYNIKDLYLS